MNTSLAPFGQVLRKFRMSKPPQSREPLPSHCSFRALSRDTPHTNCHIFKLTLLIEVFLSILESSCHELCIAYGLTFMTPSLRGWKAFPTSGAPTHTRITWAISPTAPQIPGVTPGSPLCLWCFEHSIWRGARQSTKRL